MKETIGEPVVTSVFDGQDGDALLARVVGAVDKGLHEAVVGAVDKGLHEAVVGTTSRVQRGIRETI